MCRRSEKASSATIFVCHCEFQSASCKLAYSVQVLDVGEVRGVPLPELLAGGAALFAEYGQVTARLWRDRHDRRVSLLLI